MNKLNNIIKDILLLERESDHINIKYAADMYVNMIKYVRSIDIPTNDKISFITNDSKTQIVGLMFSLKELGEQLTIEVASELNDDFMGLYDPIVNTIILSPYLYVDNSYYKKLIKIENELDFFNYFKKYITKFIDRGVFIHEFAHYLDNKYNQFLYKRSNYIDYKDDEYYNNDEEIQAYLIQFFTNYRNYFKNDRFDSFDKFKEEFLYYFNKTSPELIKNLDNISKNKFLKRLYSFWYDKTSKKT